VLVDLFDNTLVAMQIPLLRRQLPEFPFQRVPVTRVRDRLCRDPIDAVSFPARYQLPVPTFVSF